MVNKLIVISGCSGGGKSTLLSELKINGFTVFEEVGRALVKEQMDLNSSITPWQNPQPFCELLIHRSIDVFHQAKNINSAKDNVIFFDRCFLEGVNYFQILNLNKYDHFIDELRYYSTIFMTPPWKKIYLQDEERKHSFEDGLKEYEQLLKFYPRSGYKILVIPKFSVKERIQFVLNAIKKIAS